MKEDLIKLKSWFYNKEVPTFDKICLGSVLFFVLVMAGFLLFGYLSALLTKPVVTLIGTFCVFIAFSIGYLIVKYD